MCVVAPAPADLMMQLRRWPRRASVGPSARDALVADLPADSVRGGLVSRLTDVSAAGIQCSAAGDRPVASGPGPYSARAGWPTPRYCYAEDGGRRSAMMMAGIGLAVAAVPTPKASANPMAPAPAAPVPPVGPPPLPPGFPPPGSAAAVRRARRPRLPRPRASRATSSTARRRPRPTRRCGRSSRAAR